MLILYYQTLGLTFYLQAAFEKYFTESREEVFFYALKKKIALSSLNTVERLEIHVINYSVVF